MKPFLFQDFVRAKENLQTALCEKREPYALLTADTGCGKSALLRQLRSEIDRTRYRILYFAEARRLGASGLVKVLGEALRIRSSVSHSLALDRLLRAIAEDSQTIFLWIDEAHQLPDDTFDELRALAEADLDDQRRIHILLAGLPRLRAELQARAHLWRRFEIREEIRGLMIDELPQFLDHHFPVGTANRLDEDSLAVLFERARGAPGLILPMFRAVLWAAPNSKEKLDPIAVDDILERWNLA